MKVTIEPDPAPRQSPWHREILQVTLIPDTRTGHEVVLECGHIVEIYGNLAHAEGRVLCTECRSQSAGLNAACY